MFSNFWYFSPILALLELTCLVTLFDRKLQVFKNSSYWPFFGIFNELLSTQNVKVARYARNVECDFSCAFHTIVQMLATKRHHRRHKRGEIFILVYFSSRLSPFISLEKKSLHIDCSAALPRLLFLFSFEVPRDIFFGNRTCHQKYVIAEEQ